MKAYPSILAVFALAVAARPLPAADQTIDTIAGTSEVIVLNAPRGIAVDGSGAVYVADTLNHLVRKLAFSSGWSIVAGTGAAGNTGDGGAATDAKLDEPYDVDVDASGNVYIADKKNHVVRKVDAATGIISVYAGTGTDGYSGDGAAATLADMGEPFGICFDSAGNLYIADRKKHVVRKVNAISGTISTVAGDGTIGYTGDGGDATAAQLEEPYDVAVDSFGHLYIAGRKNSVVRKVNAGTGIISTYAGTGTSGYTGDGGPATAATLAEPAGLWIDSGDNLYIADRNKHVVRKVDFSTGFISTVMGTGSSGYSGDGDVGTAAQVSAPDGVAVDADGNIYVADTGNHMLRWIDAGTGEVGTLNGAGGF
ncbi:MAG: NHL repeat-containing protein, partial [Planctomycetota bacterium]